MKCAHCPLFESWDNENDSGEICAIFGDGWSSKFQYEDKNGEVIGCYIEKAYINKVNKEVDDHYAEMTEAYEDYLTYEQLLSQTEKEGDDG